MKIISYLNKETNTYHVSANFIDLHADIPKEEYEACKDNKEVLLLLVNLSNSEVAVYTRDAIDPTLAVVLPKFNGELPMNYLQYLSYVASLFEEDNPDHKYITVAYTGKLALHKDCPRFVEREVVYWLMEPSCMDHWSTKLNSLSEK